MPGEYAELHGTACALLTEFWSKSLVHPHMGMTLFTARVSIGDDFTAIRRSPVQ